MTSISDSGAQQLFGPWETIIESWSDFQVQANELTTRYPEREFVWRGARRAEWGVMSSLYRALFEILGRPPFVFGRMLADRNDALLPTPAEKY